MPKKSAVHHMKSFTRVQAAYQSGLTGAQVLERVNAGACNAPLPPLTRSVPGIIRDNVFTLFNIINAGLAVLIIMVNRYENLLFLGVAICNTTIGIFQEVRAKRSIDKLSILTQAKVSVVRDGHTCDLEQHELVLDDIMLVQTGSQICADGVVVQSDGLEADESALTGESKPVSKAMDSEVLSGSFVVSGSAYVRVNAVGGESFAWKLSHEAKREKKPTSELMRSLKVIIRVLTVVIIPLGVALFMTQHRKGMGLEAAVLGSAAAMIGMIPEGLVLLTGVAFALSAYNLAKHKTLVQSTPCVETLARVDVLCLDKTGTITDGSLAFGGIFPQNGCPLEDAEHAVSAIVHTLSDNNATAQALKAHYPQNPEWPVSEKSPFSAARKWSGCTFDGKGTYQLGAPEFLLKNIDGPAREQIQQSAADGLRVLALAHSPSPLSDESRRPTLLALLTLSDHIREQASDTFDFFKQQGVTIKVISGDNAQTVSNIACRAGVDGAQRYVDMSQAAEGDYARLAEETTVFGRVSPQQKQELVRALQRQGHVVAMTGDGVNDVLALRDADCSVAMASGSDAARNVSDVVLLSNDFSAMKQVVLEGRRVVNNIERVASLFLVKTLYSTLLTLLFIFMPLMFPFQPIQLSPTSMLTVGIPSFFLALTPSYQRLKGKFLRNVFKISLPGAICIVIDMLLIQLFAPMLSLTYRQTSTLCVFMAGIVGFVVLIHAAKPLTTPRRILIGTLIAAFLAVYVFFGRYFSLASLFSNMAALYLPLSILTYPIFRQLSQLSLRIVRLLRKLRRIRN